MCKSWPTLYFGACMQCLVGTLGYMNELMNQTGTEKAKHRFCLGLVGRPYPS